MTLAAAWRDLPLLVYAGFAVGLAWTEVVTTTPPRPDLLWRSAFPLAMVWLVVALRWTGATANERRFGLLLSIIPPVLVALIGVSGLRLPLPDATAVRLYEAGTLVLLGVVLAHAGWRGKAQLMYIALPVALYGAVLENGGILLGFFREPGYAFYVPPLPAPVSNVGGWMFAFYICTWVADQVRERVAAVHRSSVASALVAVAGALALDLKIDPLASAIGLWHWHPALPAGWLGVPVLNYVAWASAIFPLALVAYRSAVQPPPAMWMRRRLPLVLALAVVLFLCTMALLEGGVHGPTFQILREAWDSLRQVR